MIKICLPSLLYPAFSGGSCGVLKKRDLESKLRKSLALFLLLRKRSFFCLDKKKKHEVCWSKDWVVIRLEELLSPSFFPSFPSNLYLYNSLSLSSSFFSPSPLFPISPYLISVNASFSAFPLSQIFPLVLTKLDFFLFLVFFLLLQSVC